MIRRHGRDSGSPCSRGDGSSARGRLIGHCRGFYPLPGSSRGTVSTHLADGIRSACRPIGVGDDRPGPQVLIRGHGRDRGTPCSRGNGGSARGRLIGDHRG